MMLPLAFSLSFRVPSFLARLVACVPLSSPNATHPGEPLYFYLSFRWSSLVHIAHRTDNSAPPFELRAWLSTAEGRDRTIPSTNVDQEETMASVQRQQLNNTTPWSAVGFTASGAPIPAVVTADKRAQEIHAGAQAVRSGESVEENAIQINTVRPVIIAPVPLS
jgi:hypothetical protein